jgi:predicted nucleotidyltransferase component of viral defense system
VIARGAITRRAADEQMPAQTIERDYILAHLSADIGALGDARLVFKGGTLLRLCYFESYRYSADLDFSATDGLSRSDALLLVATAAAACRRRLELPALELSSDSGSAATASITFAGPLGSRPRSLKLDISDTELVESHRRVSHQRTWPDLPDGASIEGYTLGEVAAEKLRCIAERTQCRDLYDLRHLLENTHVEPLEAWELYRRKAANDLARGKQRTPPRQWAARFELRLATYRQRWEEELGDYLRDVPAFAEAERQTRRWLRPVLAAAASLDTS